MADEKQYVKYLGLAAASHSLVCGTELALNTIRKNRGGVYVMLLASNASLRTIKQISDKCSFYSIKLIQLDLSMEELSAYVGKKGLVAACAVTNKGLAEKIIENV